MTLAAVLSFTVAVLALAFAALSSPFVSLQRWRKHRMLVPIGLTSAAYSLANVAIASPGVPDPTLVWIVRAQFAAAGLYAVAWLQYAEDDLGPFPRRLGQGLRAALVLLSLLSFIPGVSASGRIAVHQVPELHLVYRDVLPTTLGTLAMAGMLAGLVLSAIAYGEAAIRGVPHAFGHFAALLAMIVGGANDAIVSYGAAAMPYLLDAGNLAQLSILTFTMTRRWAGDIQSLSTLPKRPRGLTEVSRPGPARPKA